MKPLEQYLAEYIEQEAIVMQLGSGGSTINLDIADIREIVKQGLDAYQSTEDCVVNVTEAPELWADLLVAARQIVVDFQKQYTEDSLIGKLAGIVERIDIDSAGADKVRMLLVACHRVVLSFECVRVMNNKNTMSDCTPDDCCCVCACRYAAEDKS